LNSRLPREVRIYAPGKGEVKEIGRRPVGVKKRGRDLKKRVGKGRKIGEGTEM